MPEEPFLEVVGLTKRYRSGRGLLDVSFALPPGAIVSLGGPNGSGKSTLLRCLAGLATYRGEVRLLGRPLTRDPGIRALIGYLPQAVAFPLEASVGEVIDLFAGLRGSRTETPLPAAFVPPPDERIGALSEGQRHRVGLAVALLGSPRLLLLDEPLASLDPDGRATFRCVLRSLCDREGVTAIVSSPSPTELDRSADAVLVMDGGRIVEGPGVRGAGADALGVRA